MKSKQKPKPANKANSKSGISTAVNPNESIVAYVFSTPTLGKTFQSIKRYRYVNSKTKVIRKRDQFFDSIKRKITDQSHSYLSMTHSLPLETTAASMTLALYLKYEQKIKNIKRHCKSKELSHQENLE